MSTMREKFEAEWAAPRLASIHRHKVAGHDLNGSYISCVTQAAWEAYQAATEAANGIGLAAPNEPKPCRACDPSVGFICEEHGESETEAEADAYNYACELMEQGWKERAERGVEIGTEGSLCDGIAWIFDRMKNLEAEAAKATGTAGELPPLPEAHDVKGPHGWLEYYTADQMREHGQACAYATAANYQEIIADKTHTISLYRDEVKAASRRAEHAEAGLKAARQPAPVALSDDQIYKIMMDEGIAYYHEAFAKVKAFPANAAEILDVIKKVIAATNRSQS